MKGTLKCNLKPASTKVVGGNVTVHFPEDVLQFYLQSAHHDSFIIMKYIVSVNIE